MPILRPFLSYSSADRDFVEAVAARLAIQGLLPIYDHWWLRSIAAGDVEGTKAELRMGINHADAFVHFGSDAARQSMYADYECEWALWRTCSDSPNLPMVYVFLDDRNVDVPHWFRTTLDATPETRNLEVITAGLLDAFGINANEGSSSPLHACRQLAQASALPQLRTELQDPSETIRCEAAILLAFLDDDLGPPSLSAVVRELERGLGTPEVERVVLALGKLQAKAAPAIDGIARFVESGADPHARARAVRVLGRIGPRSETISVLIRIATHATGVRAAAVTELGHMGSGAAAAVPTLVELSNTTDGHLRPVVLTALGNIGNCSCEVLASVLKALAETERQGISPSQLHHNAICILNQLAPRDCELAPALLLARRESRQFTDWFQAHYPETDVAIRNSASRHRLEQELVTTSRRIMSACQWAGGTRPV